MIDYKIRDRLKSIADIRNNDPHPYTLKDAKGKYFKESKIEEIKNKHINNIENFHEIYDFFYKEKCGVDEHPFNKEMLALKDRKNPINSEWHLLCRASEADKYCSEEATNNFWSDAVSYIEIYKDDDSQKYRELIDAGCLGPQIWDKYLLSFIKNDVFEAILKELDDHLEKVEMNEYIKLKPKILKYNTKTNLFFYQDDLCELIFLEDIVENSTIDETAKERFKKCKNILQKYVENEEEFSNVKRKIKKCKDILQKYGANEKEFTKEDLALNKDAESITIPDGFTEINDETFEDVTLEKIVLPMSMRRVMALGKLKILKNIEVDEKNRYLTVKENILFNKDMKELLLYPKSDRRDEYIIPDTVKKIAKHAFSNVEYIGKLIIPSSVIDIGWGAFSCGRIEEIEYLETAKSITETWLSKFDEKWSSKFEKQMKININVPTLCMKKKNGCGNLCYEAECLSCIKIFTFRKNNYLERIKIPNGVVCIGYAAFEECLKVESIEVPESIRYICSFAFKECIKVENITIPDSVFIIGDGAFDRCPKLCVICSEDSYAHKYCKKNDIKFKLLG
jgi:hypothetical protein